MKLSLNVLLKKLDNRTSFFDEVRINGLTLLVNNRKNSRFNTLLQFRKAGITIECNCCKVQPSYAEYTENFGLRMMVNEFNHMTIDHIAPKSKGGASSPDNYQILCWNCNHNKGNRS
jgi:hypothetical protein